MIPTLRLLVSWTTYCKTPVLKADDYWNARLGKGVSKETACERARCSKVTCLTFHSHHSRLKCTSINWTQWKWSIAGDFLILKHRNSTLTCLWIHLQFMLTLNLRACIRILINKDPVPVSCGSFYTSMPQFRLHDPRIMSIFGSTYSCEQMFLIMKLTKTSHRSHLTDQHLVSVFKVAMAFTLE